MVSKRRFQLVTLSTDRPQLWPHSPGHLTLLIHELYRQTPYADVANVLEHDTMAESPIFFYCFKIGAHVASRWMPIKRSIKTGSL
jgi:hypothetical protein